MTAIAAAISAIPITVENGKLGDILMMVRAEEMFHIIIKVMD